MISTFEHTGIRFQYPNNWTLDREDSDAGWTAVVQSPALAFLLVSLYPDAESPATLADETLAALREEYQELDVTDVVESFLGVPAIFGLGFDLPLVGVLLLLAAPTIGGMLQLGLSRAREYDADLDGATLSGDPEGLASALATLERKQSRGWEGLVLPGGRSPVPSYLRTHPRTEDRIARLNALVPGGGRQIVLQEEPARTSIVPPIRRPQVHWGRLGIWY